jgi:hypothetical protein
MKTNEKLFETIYKNGRNPVKLFEKVRNDGKQDDAPKNDRLSDNDLIAIYELIYNSKRLDDLVVAIKILFEISQDKVENVKVKELTKQYIIKLRNLFEDDVL